MLSYDWPSGECPRRFRAQATTQVVDGVTFVGSCWVNSEHMLTSKRGQQSVAAAEINGEYEGHFPRWGAWMLGHE